MAYGNNLAEIDGRYHIYTGDINKDEIVDSEDMISISNGIIEFLEGYIREDLTLDKVVDLDDLVFVYNNVTKFVIIQEL